MNYDINYLSVCTWNIGGLKSKHHNKLDNPRFIDVIKAHDIVLLSETHLSSTDFINIKGYHYYGNCRQTSGNNRNFGGLGILLRKELKQACSIIPSKSTEYNWIKLKKENFNMKTDLYICHVYIAPTKSDSDLSNEIIDHIERDINEHQYYGNIIICGDLNARTGSLTDYISSEDKYTTSDDEYRKDIQILKRRNMDMKVDARGKRVIELCIASQLRILNGRKLGDLNGSFTCHSYNGSSTIDYVIASENIVNDVTYMKVDPFDGTLSDCHCKLSFQISVTKSFTRPVYNTTQKPRPSTVKFKWTEASAQAFIPALETTLIEMKETLNIKRELNEKTVNEYASELENCIKSAAVLTLRRKSK